jgi:arylsulfatase A-like enzyme
VNERVTTLPEALRKIGYRTGAFLHGISFREEVGYAEGFDDYTLIDYVMNEPYQINPAIKNNLSPEFNKRIKMWLKENRDQPLFLFMRYYDPHFPYVPPSEYRELFLDGTEDKFEINSGILISLRRQTQTLTDGEHNYFMSQYDSCIRYLDDYFGDLLSSIDSMGFGENSIVVFSADHGEEFLEHGSYAHATRLFDESIHIPLIMRMPDRIHKRFDVMAESIDIMPTLLHILGAGTFEQLQGDPLVSYSDSGYTSKNQEYIISETGKLSGEIPHRIAVRTKEYKYILTDGKTEELYYLTADPVELSDISGQKPEICSKMNKLFLSVVEESAELRELFKPRHIPYEDTRREEIMEELRALGYLQ